MYDAMLLDLSAVLWYYCAATLQFLRTGSTVSSKRTILTIFRTDLKQRSLEHGTLVWRTVVWSRWMQDARRQGSLRSECCVLMLPGPGTASFHFAPSPKKSLVLLDCFSST